MNISLSTPRSALVLAAISLLLAPGAIHAQGWRLVGITGQQSDAQTDPQSNFIYPDNTLFEISLTNGSLKKLFRPTWVPDSHSIGYNPVDGMLYHSGGAAAYRDDPLRSGHEQGGEEIPGLAFQDNFYLEKIDLATQTMTAVLNANPCPNPDPTLPCFGLPAPRPAWALPVDRRDSTQTDPSFREKGEHEYSALRGMAWSAAENLFYVTDGEGIFRLTPNGVSTFVARPAFPIDGKLDQSKGIAFYTVGGVTQLLVGHRDGSGAEGYLISLDPATGEVVREIPLTYPPNGGDPIDSFGGLLGLAQHPTTGVLYGIRKTSDNFGREIVTIDPSTGATTLVGSMGMHMASIAFVPAEAAPPAAEFKVTTITAAGNNLTITWTGGKAPYQLQTTTTLATGSWTNLGAPTPNTSATVPMSGPLSLYRVQGSP